MDDNWHGFTNVKVIFVLCLVLQNVKVIFVLYLVLQNVKVIFVLYLVLQNVKVIFSSHKVFFKRWFRLGKSHLKNVNILAPI